MASHETHDALAQRATSHAHDRRMAALWYAWGQQAAGVGTDVDAWTFANDHAAAAFAYYNDETHYLSSVTDAWRDALGVAR